MHLLYIFVFNLLLLTASWANFFKVVSFNDLRPRIINGDKAAKGQFPWQAAIYVFFPSSSSLCGGTLISEKWVLTAGHCVQGATSFKILLGSNTLSGDDPNRVVLTTSDSVLHENYSSFNLTNDIGLILLPDEGVSFNDYIQPVSLASDQLDTNSKVTVSGWGLTSEGGDGASNDLMYVDLVTISDDECSSAYGNTIHKGVFCAKSAGDVVQSTCEGDSGGPVLSDFDNNPIHVGIISFGPNDGCESGKPVGFTRTDYFREWIRAKTGV